MLGLGLSIPTVAVIGRSAPNRPTLDLDAASDTGVSDTDNVTSDNEPNLTIGGNLVEGSVLRVYLNGVLFASHTLTAGDVLSGTFSIAGDPLPDGAHSLTITIDDGNESVPSLPLAIGIDTTAPVLSGAAGAGTADTEADISVSTTEGNGTLYWVITTAATVPSVAQIKAGQNHAGAAAVADDSFVVTASGVQSDHATGLVASTNYWVHAVQTDIAGNNSNIATSASFTTNAVYTFTNAEASAYVARMSVEPNNTRKAVIDTFFGALKSGATSGANILNDLDAFYLFGAHDDADALLNLVGTSYNCTLVSTPTHTVDRGYQGNGVDQALNSNFNPSTAVTPKYTQNSGHLGIWSLTAAQSAAVDAGLGNTLIVARNASDIINHRINAGTSGAAGGITDGSGHFVTNRTGSASANNDAYRNAVEISGSSSTSQSVSNASIYFCGRGGATPGWSVRQLMAGHIGGALTPAKITDIKNALEAYKTSIGA
jgi:hypothetical protein